MPRQKKKLEFQETEFGCFEVVGAQNTPIIRVGGRVMKTARFIYEECFGEIPEGLLVRHKCDNTYCINPEHLELGTVQDNANDLNKKRRMKGKAARHVPTDREIELAKLMLKQGYPILDIASGIGCPVGTLQRMIERS